MSLIRIIPRLEIKGPNLVKGVHLEGLRVLGRPEDFARQYYDEGADELLYMDMVASLYGRNCLLPIIERTARELFIPLTVGGGLRTIDDIRTVLRAGADKVAINTEAVRRPAFIGEAARAFGSSTIVVSIEAVQRSAGRWEALTEGGREPSGRDAVEWAQQAVEEGAGEILITAVHLEGTGRGFDLDLTKAIAQKCPVPVIAHGGAGKAADVVRALEEGMADAVALSSILHYRYLDRGAGAHAAGGGPEGNLEFLHHGAVPRHLQPATLAEIRQAIDTLGRSGGRLMTRP